MGVQDALELAKGRGSSLGIPSTQATGLDLVSTSAGFLDCGKPSLKSRSDLRQIVAYGVCTFTEFSHS